MIEYSNPWTYQGQDVTCEMLAPYVGFVYIITNLKTNKKYIGKKLVLHKIKKKKVDSGWRTYYGSNMPLLEDIKLEGIDNFSRVILYLCNSKSECSYYEAKVQFENDALIRPDEYYNEWVMVRVRRNQLKKICRGVINEN